MSRPPEHLKPSARRPAHDQWLTGALAARLDEAGMLLVEQADREARQQEHSRRVAGERDALANRIDGYRATGRTAQGAGGKVHFLVPPDPKAPAVVVKTPLSGKLDEMRRESAMYEKVGPHPNIAKTFGIQKIGGQKGLVIESITGGDMSETTRHMNRMLAENKLSEEQYWGIMQFTLSRTLEALAHVESKGVVHHDVKAPNVMIDEATGEPKLIDFGTSTGTGEPGMGTAGHHPSDGYDARASGKTDAFGVGGMAYEVRGGNDGITPGKPFDYGFPGAAVATEMLATAYERSPKVRKQALDVTDAPVELDERGGATKKKGQYGAKTAYVEFVNRLMDPNPATRLSPADALKEPFLRQRLLDDESARDALKGVIADRKSGAGWPGLQKAFDDAEQFLEDNRDPYRQYVDRLRDLSLNQVPALLDDVNARIAGARQIQKQLAALARTKEPDEKYADERSQLQQHLDDVGKTLAGLERVLVESAKGADGASDAARATAQASVLLSKARAFCKQDFDFEKARQTRLTSLEKARRDELVAAAAKLDIVLKRGPGDAPIYEPDLGTANGFLLDKADREIKARFVETLFAYNDNRTALLQDLREQGQALLDELTKMARRLAAQGRDAKPLHEEVLSQIRVVFQRLKAVEQGLLLHKSAV